MDDIAYLHDQGVCHRDLKPENILIHKNIAKIVYFGFSKVMDKKDVKEQGTTVETSFYMAP